LPKMTLSFSMPMQAHDLRQFLSSPFSLQNSFSRLKRPFPRDRAGEDGESYSSSSFPPPRARSAVTPPLFFPHPAENYGAAILFFPLPSGDVAGQHLFSFFSHRARQERTSFFSYLRRIAFGKPFVLLFPFPFLQKP